MSPRQLFESLESRRLFTIAFDPVTHVLTLTGGAGAANDSIKIEIVAADYACNVNGAVASVAVSAVDQIVVNAGDGNDAVYVEQAADPVTVNGGLGSDVLELAFYSGNASQITSAIFFDGGGGSDKVDLWDTSGNAAANDAYTYTWEVMDRTGTFGSLETDFVENVNVSASAGNNTFNINTVRQGITLSLFGGDGNDVANIGMAGAGLSNVSGVAMFSGDAGNDTLHVDDAAATQSDAYTLNATTLDRTGGLFGLIQYQLVDDIILDAQSGNNLINLDAADALVNHVTINGGAGNDLLLITQPGADVDAIHAHVQFNGGGDSDTAIVNDSAAPASRTYNFTASSMAMTSNFGGLSWTATESLVLNGGTHGNVVNIASASSFVATTINSGAGDDNVHLGTGNLDQIGGAITLHGGGGYDTLFVHDDGVAYNDTYTITNTKISRTFFTGITYDGVDWIELRAENGSNTINVNGSHVGLALDIYCGGGNDQVHFAAATLSMDDAGGTHAVHGGSGADSVTFHDTLGVAACSWEVWPDYIVRLPAGADIGNVVSYEDMESLTVEAGKSSDVITVANTNPLTPVRVRGGADAADTITIEETSTAAPVTILPSAGSGPFVDVNANGLGNATTLFDQTQRLSALTIGAGGSARLVSGANMFLRVAGALNITGSGRFDLTDNDLVLDYGGGPASPVGTWNGSAYTGVSGLIQRGSNGGLWDGALGGIFTSAPAAALGHTTLAIAEARDVLGITGAQTAVFDGETVDATTLIVKYTHAGDANLDGIISGDDYFQIDSGFPQTLRAYVNGDFNFDGIIDGDDYFLIDSNFPSQGLPL